jgi:hypothetical protein
MYLVTEDDDVKAQVAALPVEALTAYAELRTLLETAPWSGRPYIDEHPDRPMRTHAFGAYGAVIYLVLDDQRRVDVLLVQWLG